MKERDHQLEIGRIVARKEDVPEPEVQQYLRRGIPKRGAGKYSVRNTLRSLGTKDIHLK